MKKSERYFYELKQYMMAFGLPIPTCECKFDPKRKWRFDFAYIQEKIAIEIDGGVWIQGRHSGGSGQIKDMEKFNRAVILGWRVLHYTPQQLADIPNDVRALMVGNDKIGGTI